MMRIVIAGCGDVGSALGLQLSAQGHQVWGLRRHPEKLPSPIRPLAADLSDPGSLDVLPADVDAVYYTASAGGFDETRYRAAYDDGVAHLLAALTRVGARPRRVFLTSSSSVYGDAGGGWVDEDSEAGADGFAGRCLRAGERRLWDGPFAATVVRFAGIYGPGRTRLLDSLRDGSARCTPGVYSNRIHRDDCGGFLAHLLTLQRPHRLYLGVDDAPVALCEVLDWLAARLGVDAPVRAAAPRGGRRGGNKRCRNDRLRASGYALLYPSYRDGYAALLDDDAAV